MNKNLSAIAYEKLKEMILSGELSQGQAFSINAMAEKLQISRTPVTNACQRLENEKLLTIMPKQGAVINTISIETARGIYELRAAIESYNGRKVFDLLSDSDIIYLEDSILKQKEFSKDGKIKEFMDEDSNFHRYILEKNRNKEILDTINGLYDRAYMLGISNSKGMRSAQSISEHEKIILALKNRDRQGFADAIEENILNGFRHLTSQML
ncbi:MAG: GntR family transcriptional regulator [Clostridia bacterium]|nr:GntR family transcriptional regulator [Clostridia bacterium]